MSIKTHMTKTTIITLLVSFTVSCIVYMLCDRKFQGRWGFYAAALPLFLGLIMSVAWVVVAFRATMVTWITVLVLLTFAGNRRRVLIRRGRVITGEVTGYLVPLIFQQKKGLFAVACAALLSLLAILR